VPAVETEGDADVAGAGAAPVAAETVSGRRKAAVLLAALGPDLAAEVVAHLSEDEIEALSLELARLDNVEPRAADQVLAEMASSATSSNALATGGDMAYQLLTRALGETRADELMGRTRGPVNHRPFEFLRRSQPEQVAALLQHESPQLVALVITNLGANQGAQVLARLPEHMRPEVALRIARIGEVSPEVIRQVEELTRSRLSAVSQQEGYATADGVNALAEILGRSDRATERAVLEHLSTSDSELAEDVRSKLFVFEDLVKLEDRALQQVLREADQKDLVLAMRSAAEEVKEKIFANMSERGAEMLKEELEVQQPQRKSDIDAAQSRIVAVVRKLDEAGAIVIARPQGETGEEDAVI
jgi:flagellar motor switch protein FliG